MEGATWFDDFVHHLPALPEKSQVEELKHYIKEKMLESQALYFIVKNSIRGYLKYSTGCPTLGTNEKCG